MLTVQVTVPEDSESDASRGRTLRTKPLNASDRSPSTHKGSATSREVALDTNTSSKTSDLSGEPQNLLDADDYKATCGAYENLSETTIPSQPINSRNETNEPIQAVESIHVGSSNVSEQAKTSWLTIASTLEACFGSDGDAHTLTAKVREELGIPQDLSNFGDSASQTLVALNDDVLASAPDLMKAFVAHGEACSHAENEALNLAAVDVDDAICEEDPLQVYIEMLDRLEDLDEKGKELEDRISELIALAETDSEATDTSGPRSQVANLFKACLSVLGARMSNLAMAQDLVDGVQENISLTLRMEDLGL